MSDLNVQYLLRGVRLGSRWGGRREGAGRKPVSELTARGEYMGFAITSQQWVARTRRSRAVQSKLPFPPVEDSGTGSAGYLE